jgi:hypothetical protein
MMTFAFAPQQAAARDDARAFAQRLAARAASIDGSASVPEETARELGRFATDDALATVAAVEEIAAVSAAAAMNVIATPGTSLLRMTGLRGATEVDQSSRGQLILTAVALGIGRAALEAALEELRRSTATPGADTEKPHWVVADVATDLDAARLLAYKAARSSAVADIALARLMATAAATRAVDAAIRVLGPAALLEGSIVERLSRDVRAVSVLSGTEEDQRAVAADGLLPR